MQPAADAAPGAHVQTAWEGGPSTFPTARRESALSAAATATAVLGLHPRGPPRPRRRRSHLRVAALPRVPPHLQELRQHLARLRPQVAEQQLLQEEIEARGATLREARAAAGQRVQPRRERDRGRVVLGTLSQLGPLRVTGEGNGNGNGISSAVRRGSVRGIAAVRMDGQTGERRERSTHRFFTRHRSVVR